MRQRLLLLLPLLTVLVVVILLPSPSEGSGHRSRRRSKGPRFPKGKRALLQFYTDGRHPKEYPYPAAYIELKYPILRHPRTNTIDHPPILIKEGSPPPPATTIITHTHTHHHDFGNDLKGRDHEDEQHYNHNYAEGEGRSLSSVYGEVEDQPPSTAVLYSENIHEAQREEVPTYDEHIYAPPKWVGGGGPGTLSSSAEMQGSYSQSHIYPFSAVAAPLTENIPSPPIPIQPDEKIIKNVVLDEYIWVRREEGTTNIRLTLDPLKKSSLLLDDVVEGRRIHVVSKERVCIQGLPWDGAKAAAAPCSGTSPLTSGIGWDFVEINHGQYWIVLSGSHHCLTPSPSFASVASASPRSLRFVELQPCDKGEAGQLWEIGSNLIGSSY